MPGLLTRGLHFRIQKDGSLKVYRENVSTASYDTSQYCVSFTDQASIFDDYESQPQSNTTVMYTDMMQDPDMIQDCSDIFKDCTFTTIIILSQKCLAIRNYLSEQLIFS